MVSSKDVIIRCDHDSARIIAEEIRISDANQCHITDRRNFDGRAAEWIVLATVSLKTLPALLDVIRKFIDDGRIQSIKVGETEIVRPTRSQVATLLSRDKDSDGE